MKTILATLALVFSAQAFATSAYIPVDQSKIVFAPISRSGLKATPSSITTKPIKIKGRVFVGTDVGLYQVEQTRTGYQATPAFTDCRADDQWLDCNGIQDLEASPENETHARVEMRQNWVKYDLFLGYGYSYVGSNEKVYFGSL